MRDECDRSILIYARSRLSEKTGVAAHTPEPEAGYIIPFSL
jgi:hypothetical protein